MKLWILKHYTVFSTFFVLIVYKFKNMLIPVIAPKSDRSQDSVWCLEKCKLKGEHFQKVAKAINKLWTCWQDYIDELKSIFSHRTLNAGFFQIFNLMEVFTVENIKNLLDQRRFCPSFFKTCRYYRLYLNYIRPEFDYSFFCNLNKWKPASMEFYR